MSDFSIIVIVGAILLILYVYKDLVIKVEEHRAKTFVYPDPIIPKSLLLALLPDSEDHGNCVIVNVEGFDFAFKDNGEIALFDTAFAKWRKISMKRTIVVLNNIRSMSVSTPQQLAPQASTVNMPIVNGANNTMSNKEAKSHVQQNTLFTDAEQANRNLPQRFQWVFVGPNEWAIEAK